MENVKLIFLGIDGVLNGDDKIAYQKYRFFRRVPFLHRYAKYDDVEECFVKRLARICHLTNAKVVLSSSWKNELLDDNLRERKTDTYTAKLFWEYMDKYNIDIIGKTPTITLKNRIQTRREDEIISWLSKHEDEYSVDSFIILDDEKSDLMCFYGSNLVLTAKSSYCQNERQKYKTGLRKEYMKKAIEKLNKIA